MIEEVLMKDDRGWIFEDIIETKLVSGKEMENTLLFVKDEHHGKEGHSTILYALAIYATKPYTLITRSYMKIQDLAAVVGGFLKIFLIFGSCISDFFGTYLRNEMFYNLLFQNADNKTESKKKNEYVKQLYSNMEMNNFTTTNNYINNSANIEPKKIINKKKIQVDNDDNNNVLNNNNSIKEVTNNVLNNNNSIKEVTNNVLNNNNSLIKELSNNQINNSNSLIKELSNNQINNSNFINDFTDNQVNNSNFNIKDLNDSKLNNSNIIDKNVSKKIPIHIDLARQATLKMDNNNLNKTIKFGMWKMIKGTTCFKKSRSRQYDIVEKYLRERLDVGFYLKNIAMLDRIRGMLFNREENIVFEIMRKPNLSLEEDMKSINLIKEEKDMEIAVFVDYMRNKIERKILNERDMNLIDIVDNNIKGLIYS